MIINYSSFEFFELFLLYSYSSFELELLDNYSSF